jgi:hypothetical protein
MPARLTCRPPLIRALASAATEGWHPCQLGGYACPPGAMPAVRQDLKVRVDLAVLHTCAPLLDTGNARTYRDDVRPNPSMVRRLCASVPETSEGARVFPEPGPESGLEYRVRRQYRVVAFVGFPFEHLCLVVIAQGASGDLAPHPREQSGDWLQSKPPEGSFSQGSAPSVRSKASSTPPPIASP